MVGWAVWSLCQMAAVNARTRCTTRTQTPAGVPAVSFQIQLAFEGVFDRLDDLPQRFEEPGAGPVGFAFAGRAQHVQTGIEGGLELAAEVVLVRDHDLPGPPRGQLRAHSTGVESATHTPSVHMLVFRASTRSRHTPDPLE